MPSGTLNGIHNPEKLGGQKSHTYQNQEERPTSHHTYLLYRTFVLRLF